VAERLSIQIGAPLTAVRTLRRDAAAQGHPAPDETAAESAQAALEAERAALAKARQAIERAATELTGLGDTIAQEAEANMTPLAVAIAEKILRQAVEAGQYDMKTIVRDALRSAPSRREVVVRMNPDDLARLENGEAAGKPLALGNVRLIADATVGRAECVVETAEGTVEARLQDQLEQVHQALAQPE